MSYNNFVPTVWRENIERELERNMVFAEDCNRDYEGDVKEKGDSVRILGVGSPTVTTTNDKNVVLEDPENVESTSTTLLIDTMSHFNYMVGDIDKAQSVGNVMGALSDEASLKCAGEMDKSIAKLALDRLAVLHNKTSEVATSDNALDLLDMAAQKLYENDVSTNDKIIAVVPPWYWMRMKKRYLELDTDNSKMMKDGKVYRYGNIFIKLSNNVAVSSGDTRIMVRTKRAIAFCNPKTHVEAYRPEKMFADAVKGYVLYGSKIVRPKEMIVLNVKPQ